MKIKITKQNLNEWLSLPLETFATGLTTDLTPEPVEVPQMFDDWCKEKEVYEYSKICLISALYEDYSETEMNDDLDRWLNSEDNFQTAIEAILYGYTIEKPKRWWVKVPKTEHWRYYKMIEADKPALGIYDSRYSANDDGTMFTQKELDAYGLNDMKKVEVQK